MREISDVAAHELVVEAHGIYTGEYLFVDRRSNGVKELLEGMARARLRCVRPEQEKELVPASPACAGCREYREQREPSALVAVPAKNRVFILSGKAQGSEGSKPKAVP
jgi:hypothetical protein